MDYVPPRLADPFAITPARLAGAKWFAGIWKRLGLRDGVHLRRMHYVMISQKKPVRMVNGTPYENEDALFQVLIRNSGDARFLDLVAAEHFVDRRNAEPPIRLSNESDPGFLTTIHKEPPEVGTAAVSMPELPRFWLSPPTILQPYHIEIWCEKTTINDILEPIADQYGLNVVTGAGELSQTLCVNLVERAEQSDRPVRILYISDFDPAGQSMPVAVARKIEHRLALKNLHLDIQVRPIALTQEQCEEYQLPRTPIKEGERRASRFEERFGEGATELDALEALHPGELRRIIEREIERYYDADLDDAVREQVDEVNADLSEIVTQTHDQFRSQIKPLQSEWDNIEREHAREVEAWRKRANPIWQAIAKSLTKQKSNLDQIDWPEPADGDEDVDPLFDSTRSYVEQIDRYKKYQDKPITRKSSKRGDTTDD